MFPPHLIWEAHSDSGKVSKEVLRAEEKYNCTATTTTSGWNTGESFKKWAEAEFFDRIKYPPRKTLIILDLYAAHRTAELLLFFREREIDV